MFIRARQHRQRIQFSLADARHVDGSARSIHIAALGSVPSDMDVADRTQFWQQVHQRLKKLDNKLNKGARAKVLAQLAAKVPVPTPTERRKAEQDASAAAAELKQMLAILTKAGWTDHDTRQAVFLGELDDEFQEVVAETVRSFDRASGIDGIYRIGQDGDAQLAALPTFKRVGSVFVSFDFPRLVLVLTDVNRRHSISGSVPIIAPR